jgi:hypothetical protein
MTPRAYWDFFDNLWEIRVIDGEEYLYLLWSPTGPVIGPACHGRKAILGPGIGPLVGVA